MVPRSVVAAFAATLAPANIAATAVSFKEVLIIFTSFIIVKRDQLNTPVKHEPSHLPGYVT
jgi:hypothetical protein